MKRKINIQLISIVVISIVLTMVLILLVYYGIFPKYLLLFIKDVLYAFVSATLICVSSTYTLYQLYNIASPIKRTLYILEKLG